MYKNIITKKKLEPSAKSLLYDKCGFIVSYRSTLFLNPLTSKPNRSSSSSSQAAIFSDCAVCVICMGSKLRVEVVYLYVT